MKVYPIKVGEFKIKKKKKKKKKDRQYPSSYLRKRDFNDCPSVTEKPRLGTTA